MYVTPITHGKKGLDILFFGGWGAEPALFRPFLRGLARYRLWLVTPEGLYHDQTYLLRDFFEAVEHFTILAWSFGVARALRALAANRDVIEEDAVERFFAWAGTPWSIDPARGVHPVAVAQTLAALDKPQRDATRMAFWNKCCPTHTLPKLVRSTPVWRIELGAEMAIAKTPIPFDRLPPLPQIEPVGMASDSILFPVSMRRGWMAANDAGLASAAPRMLPGTHFCPEVFQTLVKELGAMKPWVSPVWPI